ncbi:hypothetical protein NIIDNTM18_00430 [Mycolicibacterium litorale]|uniref:Uncharacterized protein n=1 Tax=Mycolicibacterium litorale TaxID=758802 RepID=A0A6S6NXN4_9MYCO|nr:hypothetical protein NIIDNTM18_00430 [Mycolicibacterium litorale]
MGFLEAARRHGTGIDEPLPPFQKRAEAWVVVGVRVFGHRGDTTRARRRAARPSGVPSPPHMCIASDSTIKSSKLSTDSGEQTVATD